VATNEPAVDASGRRRAGAARRRSRWNVAADALVLAGLLYIAFVWLGVAPYAPPVPDYGPMFDARGFWIAWDGGLYDIPWRTNEAYVYSPAFAQLLWPFTLLPWPVFAAGWTLAAIGCLFWMRVPWMIAFPGVIDDILRGNIHVFLAASIVLALRHPSAWAFGIFTKATPGIGLIWPAVRREWRGLGVALATCAMIFSVSFILSASLWFEWFGLLAENAGETARIQVIPLPLVVRLPIAAALIAYAAWTDRAWILPIGVMVGLPNVWTSSTALLAAVPALWHWRERSGANAVLAANPRVTSSSS
jgi:hypothetical protein